MVFFRFWSQESVVQIYRDWCSAVILPELRYFGILDYLISQSFFVIKMDNINLQVVGRIK